MLSTPFKYYKRAQGLTPVNAGPSLLLNVYRYYAPNKAEAKRAEQAVLATIPLGLKLSARLQQFLARQGIVVPEG